MYIGRKKLLSLLSIFVILVGPTLVMVDAAYVPTAMIVHTQSFDKAENNHTYVYTNSPEWGWYDNQFLTQENDVDYTAYWYEKEGWQTNSLSYPGPAEREFLFDDAFAPEWGWLDEAQWIPTFRDLDTDDPESEIGAKSIATLFSIGVNAEQTLLMDSGYIYTGTFNVTNQEFFHLTISCHQDGTDLYWTVYDYDYRQIVSDSLSDSDIDVTPFKPSGNGTYFLVIRIESDDPAPVPVDILLEPIIPEILAFGDVVEGNLPGSEIITDDANNGAWVYEQLRPNIHTYKFSTNSTQIGRISILFENLGGLFMMSYVTKATITSDLFVGSYRDTRWEESASMPSSVFYYTSFANETYYITIQGMDNTDFTLLNQMVNVPVLPMNEEFFIQNWQSEYYEYPYRLSLGQDAVVRLNSTEWGGGFYWEFWTVTDDGYSETFSIAEGTTFEGASTYYLPAGDYLIRARSSGAGASGLYEFNIGPILDGVGNVEVYVDRVVGVRVPVENLLFYRSNLTILNHENISVYVDLDYINTYGSIEYVRSSLLIGNRQDGVNWVAYGTNTTSIELGLDTSSYSMFCDGYAIIALAPYRILNNTAGLSGNEYYGRSVDFAITFDEDQERIITDFDEISIGSDIVWSNLTLVDMGISEEYYVVYITGAEGVWMNLTVIVEDVGDWQAFAYQDLNGHPQILHWTGDLDYTFVGDSSSEGSFQFGGISDDIALVFYVERDLLDNGTLSVGIMPYVANHFDYIPAPTYYGDGIVPSGAPLAIDTTLVIGGIAIIAIVVVVAVVYARKTGRI